MKGQISLEAVMVIGVAIILLTSFFNLNIERFSTARDLGEASEGRMAGELLATAINTGYANGDGFSLYLGKDKMNFSKLSSMGMALPLVIDLNSKTIIIRKSTTVSGGMMWNATVQIVPANVAQASPTAKYPEVTIFNNGTGVIIYANESNIMVQ